MATFSATWTLPSDTETPNAPPLRSEAFPSEWTLKTIPESVSDTATVQSDDTREWDRSTATTNSTPPPRMPTSETVASVLPSSQPSQSFEKSWTLPRHVDPRIPVAPPVLPSHTWSPGAPLGDYSGPDASSSISGVMGKIPSHMVSALDSSSSAQYDSSRVKSAAAAFPGDFRPRGYSYHGQSSEQAQQSAQSSAQSPGFRQVRPPRPAAYATDDTSPLSPGDSSASAGVVSLYPAGAVARPAGFATDSSSPWNVGDRGQASNSSGVSWNRGPDRLIAYSSNTSPEKGSDSTNLYSHRPPRPAGFAPDTVTPQTPGDALRTSPATASLPGPTGLWRPIDAAENRLAPVEVPVYAATLQEGSPWAFADLDQAYDAPAAPLTATAPWRAGFPRDEIQWRNL
ncbi:hypothetical protein AK830_g985 [Neonectria ditissima]|uniref:Uncharacterized protein n=1 Tax=Neonectria ditissima TaxID=78410 RepID=A0A0P7BXM9_9HYPO|nr:hypothetical protein AK830_g985 [Neonectria ditissima]